MIIADAINYENSLSNSWSKRVGNVKLNWSVLFIQNEHVEAKFSEFDEK